MNMKLTIATFFFVAFFANTAKASIVIEFVGAETHYEIHAYQNYDYFDYLSLADSLGGYLASVESQDEQDLIMAHLDTTPNRSYQNVLIGANDIENEGFFVWQDGTPVLFSNWREGEPNNSSWYNSEENGFSIFEDVVVIASGDNLPDGHYGFWNDAPATMPFHMALIEFNNVNDITSSASNVSTLGAPLFGLLGFLFLASSRLARPKVILPSTSYMNPYIARSV